MSGGEEPPAMADVHCHFVPGVDDGAPDLSTALRWLRREHEAGVTRVATTPHLPASRARSGYRRRAEDAFVELRSAAREEMPDLGLRLAFEVRMDGAELDPEDQGLWLGTGGHVLVEYDLFRRPADDPAAPMRPLLEAGLVPVLAHPERYRGMEDGTGWARRLKEAGVLLAVNAGSLLGSYGVGPERTARRLLAEGLVDLVASDHHARPPRTDGLGEVRGRLAGTDPAAARRLLWENPAAVLDGEETASAPRLELPPADGGDGRPSERRRGGAR